jgi:hypothetical protein
MVPFDLPGLLLRGLGSESTRAWRVRRRASPYAVNPLTLRGKKWTPGSGSRPWH